MTDNFWDKNFNLTSLRTLQTEENFPHLKQRNHFTGNSSVPMPLF